MKLNGPSDSNLGKPLKLNDFSKLSSEKKTEDKPLNKAEKLKRAFAEAADSADLQAVNSSLETLAQHGRSAPLHAGNRIRTNQSNGLETLVQFKDDKDQTVVLRTASEQDVHLYAALLSGSEKNSPAARGFQGLKTSAAGKNLFFLERKGEYLSTDAAGAAVAMTAESPVIVKRSDGQYGTYTDLGKAAEFVAKSDPKLAASRAELKSLEGKGLTFSEHKPDKPEGTEKKQGIVGRILQLFEDSSKSPLEIDKTFSESLAKDKVDVSFEVDDRPLPLPITLSMDEIKMVADWKDSSHQEIKNFQKDFKALADDESIFMAQQPYGEAKGMVLRADDRATFFQLRQGKRVVALDKKGDLHELTSLKDFAKFKENGRVTEPNLNPFDGEKTDSDNLMMFYHVAPFDPINVGLIDDLPQRITNVGSSEQVDIVTMRSDLPTKKNLRVDRAQKGELQEIKRLDPELAMNNPKVLEDFVFETVLANKGDEKIRFLVGGHGGAEKGLLPDGEHNNAEANHAMPVDKFAGAIKKALDRVEKKTGDRPKIDNLMLVSCLMGNTSFIHALAQTGDVESLVASPELMAGSNPISTFEYLANPETSKASGLEYAQHLVDEWSVAPSSVGGNKEQHHADTIGAYDLDPAKAKRFQKALGGFFKAAIAEPKFAEYLKEGIAKAPSYGINPLINLQYDVDNRDLLQVLDHTTKDARITSPKLKKAMAELKEATEAQVIDQKVSEDYKGRRGPSLYLPLDKWDFNKEMTDTELLKGVPYKEFMDLVFDAPLQRGVLDNLLNEASRISETGVLDSAFKKLREVATGKKKQTEEAPSTSDDVSVPKMTEEQATAFLASLLPEGAVEEAQAMHEITDGQEVQDLRALHSLEQDIKARPFKRAIGFARSAVTGALGLTAGVIGGAIGAVPGAIFGAFAGARAGWTGTSMSGTSKPASKEEMEVLTKVVDDLLEANGLGKDDAEVEDSSKGAKDIAKDAKAAEVLTDSDSPSTEEAENQKPDLSALDQLLEGRVAKGLAQILLWPSEGAAIKTHEAAGRKLGEMPGRIVGALIGTLSGAVTTGLAAGAVAFTGAGLVTKAVGDKVLGKLEPEAPAPEKDLYFGRFEAKPDEPTP